MTLRRIALLASLSAGLLGGCSWLDAINPFSSSGPKLPELPQVKNTGEVQELWRGSVSKSGEYTLVPLVAGDSVYAAGRKGDLARFDGGRQVWKIDVGMVISGGVGGDGKMIVVGSPKGEVAAVSPDGKVLWKSRVSSEVLAPPAIGEGMVVVRTADSRMHGLDVADGKRKWSFVRTSPSLSLRSYAGSVIVGKSALAGFPGGKLIAVNLSNGGQIWEATVALPKGATELERVADVTSAPVLGPKQVCAVAYQGRMGCFEPGSGSAIWTRDISSAVGLDTDGKRVFVTDEKGNVHGLDINTGASLWKQDKLVMRSPSRPVAFGGYVAVADSKGMVHVLSAAEGAFVARYSVDSLGVRADPVRLTDTSVLVQDLNGDLHAYAAR